MTFAFFGANGASGVLILIGLAILAVLSAILLVGGLVFAFGKRPKLAVTAILVSLAFGYYPCKVLVGFSQWAETQKNKKREFKVEARLSPDGEYRVTVDGTPNPEEVISLDGEIAFHIDLSDSRMIGGRCTHFRSRRVDGEFASLELGGIDIRAETRSALLASLQPPPKGAKRDGQTETYTIWFRKASPDFEWFTCMRRTKQP
jgi:hypothetical protein